MDFDSRLSVFVPLATERPIEKESDLWSRYKEAKRVRNQVTHAARKVSAEDAQAVLSTVYDWLSFLGSTAELDVALLGLKRFLEQQPSLKSLGPSFGFTSLESITSRESILEKLISKYLMVLPERNIDANVELTSKNGASYEIDYVISLGNYKVALEVKWAVTDLPRLDMQYRSAVSNVKRILHESVADFAAVLLLIRGELPEKYASIEKYYGGKITILPIHVRDE